MCPEISVEKLKINKRSFLYILTAVCLNSLFKSCGVPSPRFYQIWFLKASSVHPLGSTTSTLQGTCSPSCGFSMSGQASVKNSYVFLFLA